jgi:hypothetical protein
MGGLTLKGTKSWHSRCQVIEIIGRSSSSLQSGNLLSRLMRYFQNESYGKLFAEVMDYVDEEGISFDLDLSLPALSFSQHCFPSSTVFFPALSPLQHCLSSGTVSIPALFSFQHCPPVHHECMVTLGPLDLF